MYTFIWGTFNESTCTSCFGTNCRCPAQTTSNYTCSSQPRGYVYKVQTKWLVHWYMYYPLNMTRLYTPAGPDRPHNHMQTSHKNGSQTLYDVCSQPNYFQSCSQERMLAKTKAVDLRLFNAGQHHTSCIQPPAVCSTKQKEGSLDDKEQRVCNVPLLPKYANGIQDTFTPSLYIYLKTDAVCVLTLKGRKKTYRDFFQLYFQGCKISQKTSM